MSRKAFIILVIFLLLAAAVAYWLFSQKEDAPPATEETRSEEGLFPFGKSEDIVVKDPGTLATEDDPTLVTLSGISGSESPLVRIWAEPNAGAVFIDNGTTTIIRFVDRGTGHIYDATPDGVTEKISNVTIPRIDEVLWSKKGDRLAMRYIKDDSSTQTFLARIASTSVSSAIEGIFFIPNVRTMEVLGDSVLYVDPGSGGKIMKADIDGSKKTDVLDSGFEDWSMSWNNPKSAFIYPKPSGTITGVGFILDVQTGALSMAIKDIFGLEGTVSPNGEYVFASASQNGKITSAIYSTSKKNLTPVVPGTLKEKCEWSVEDGNTIYCAIPTVIPSGTYPDDWYKGLVAFSDQIWKIDAGTAETELVFDPSVFGREFDIERIMLGPKDGYVSFTNKTDQTLWLYRFETDDE